MTVLIPEPTSRAAWSRYEGVLALASGLLATFYGRHFTYSLLFAQILDRPDCKPVVDRVKAELRRVFASLRFAWREGFPRLREANQAARELMRRLGELNEARAQARSRGDLDEADVLEHELSMLQADAMRMGLAVGSALGVQDMDSERVSDAVRSAYDSLWLLTFAATSNGCAKAGVRVNVGAEIVLAVNNSVGNLVRRLLQRLRDYSDAVDFLQSEPTCRWWLDWTINVLCNSLGLGLAYYFEGLLFHVANALFGAELLLHAAELAVARALGPAHASRLSLRPSPTVALYGKWALAVTGVYYQQLGGGRRLPLSLRAVLFAPLLGERCVRYSAFAIRGPLRA